MKILAHRGYRARYPENTMLAFRKAWETGCDGIELDVQRTADGRLVIIHDETVDRTTNGRGAVESQTFSQLRQLDAGAGERVPTLEEYLEWALNTSLITNIELKNNRVDYPGLEEQVIDGVRKRGLEERTILSSFNHASVLKCKKIAPEIRCGLLCGREWNTATVLEKRALAGIEYVNPSIQSLNERKRMELVEGNIPLLVWTVNDEAQTNMLSNCTTVWGIITDDPAQIRQWLVEKSSASSYMT